MGPHNDERIEIMSYAIDIWLRLRETERERDYNEWEPKNCIDWLDPEKYVSYGGG